MKTVDLFAVVWLAGFSVAAFIAFGFDKWRATRSKWRMSEFSLVLLAALGGWAGGVVGMNLFRHKTAKLSFKLKYALALVPFLGEVWAWVHWR